MVSPSYRKHLGKLDLSAKLTPKSFGNSFGKFEIYFFSSITVQKIDYPEIRIYLGNFWCLMTVQTEKKNNEETFSY